jgi:cell division protein FtsB
MRVPSVPRLTSEMGNSRLALLSALDWDESIVQRTSSFMPPERTESKRTSGAEPLRRHRALPVAPSLIRKRGLHVLLIFITVVLIVDALVGEKGLMQSMSARRQYQQLQASLEELRHENAALREEMRRLNEDPATIESLARQDLGLIRPGEVVFILKDLKDDTK